MTVKKDGKIYDKQKLFADYEHEDDSTSKRIGRFHKEKSDQKEQVPFSSFTRNLNQPKRKTSSSPTITARNADKSAKSSHNNYPSEKKSQSKRSNEELYSGHDAQNEDKSKRKRSSNYSKPAAASGSSLQREETVAPLKSTRAPVYGWRRSQVSEEAKAQGQSNS